MLRMRITIIIIAFAVVACGTLPQRNTDTGSVSSDSETSVARATNVPIQTLSQKPAARSAVNPQLKTEVTGQIEFSDIWSRIRDNLSLQHHIDQASVKAKIAWYARHQDYLDRVTARARPYIFHIVEELDRRNMPMELALLPIVESAYHPFAYSHSHASGIWQFIPSTGKLYGLKQNWWYDGRRDIVAATDAALRYLGKLDREFGGNWLYALAAYNSGERNVTRAIARNKRTHRKIDFWSLRLPRETRGYVPSLLAVAELLSHPEHYGVHWQPIENKPYFVRIDVQRQLDLAAAASLADMSMDEIYTLNPAYNRWATDPAGPHVLLIPVEKRQVFVSRLRTLPDAERISWKRHVIRHGENLGQIAQNYHTNINILKQTNKLRSNLIREGRSLLIPSSIRPLKHYTLSQNARRYRGLKRSADGKNQIYTVHRGDTLWDIGQQYGVSIKQICTWNGLRSSSILRPGKKLNLWLSANEKNTAQAIPANYDTVKLNTVNYTVKKGDSLWLIARRFSVTIKQLRAWNNLAKNKFLRPGQRLEVQNTQSDITGV